MNYSKTNSFISCCISAIATSLLSIHVVIISTNPSLAGFNYVLYSEKIVSYALITSLPCILLNLMFSSIKIQMRLLSIGLKLFLSIALSMVLLTAIGEIKPLGGERSTLFAVIGVFTLLMLAVEARRNRDAVMPTLAHRVLIVGNGPLADDMQHLIATGRQGYRVAGRINYPPRKNTSPDAIPADLCETAKRLKADKVLISLAERRGIFPLQEMLSCKLSGIEVLDAPTLYERITGKLLIENITPSWFIFCHGFQLSAITMAAKRLTDIICGLVGILLFLPFAPLVMLAIMMDSPGPVLFRQIRVGKGDNNFVLYKFRTMRQDAEKTTGAVWASCSDCRITRVGSFLRKSRIDEIPQLINVLCGEMSLVGPRPERPEFVSKLKEVIPYYSERHFVKPGATGWAQVSYPYGASVEDAIEKLRYDLYYIKNLSLLFDIKIIIQTILVVLFQKGGR